MSSWVAAIVKMTDGAWTKLRAHHVEATSSAIKPWVLVDGGSRFGTIEAFAKAVARDLDTDALALAAQTSADAHGVWHYRGNQRVRALVYSRDSGGWLTDEGDAQDWESSFSGQKAGDSRSTTDVMEPSSIAPFERLCRHFDLEAHKPSAIWSPPKRGFFARLLGR